MLKFLKLLRFNKRIGMLSKSLDYARSDLSSFAFVFLIFMLAYAQMGFAVFGRSLRAYKSFFTSMTTCFRMLLGEINAQDMLDVSRVYGKAIEQCDVKVSPTLHSRTLLFSLVHHSCIYCSDEHLSHDVSERLDSNFSVDDDHHTSLV